MSTHLETIDLTEDALKAAKKMRDKHISSLLIIDSAKDETPVGIVTKKDLVDRVCAEGVSSRETSIHKIMSSPVATVESLASVETAADLMLSNKVRHLLVIEEQTGKPMGIVAPTDLNRYLRSNIDMDEVSKRILKAVQAEERPRL